MQIINGIIHAVKQKQQEIAESMVSGRFANFESYQRYVGLHMGYADALEIINHLLEEKDSNDDKL